MLDSLLGLLVRHSDVVSGLGMFVFAWGLSVYYDTRTFSKTCHACDGTDVVRIPVARAALFDAVNRRCLSCGFTWRWVYRERRTLIPYLQEIRNARLRTLKSHTPQASM